jgi:hypothetical protein
MRKLHWVLWILLPFCTVINVFLPLDCYTPDCNFLILVDRLAEGVQQVRLLSAMSWDCNISDICNEIICYGRMALNNQYCIIKLLSFEGWFCTYFLVFLVDVFCLCCWLCSSFCCSAATVYISVGSRKCILTAWGWWMRGRMRGVIEVKDWVGGQGGYCVYIWNTYLIYQKRDYGDLFLCHLVEYFGLWFSACHNFHNYSCIVLFFLAILLLM